MKGNIIQYKWYTRSISSFLQDRFIRYYEGEEEGMRLNEVEKDQLDIDILTYLVICLNHCLYCLFAKHDFTSYVEQKDLEKYLNKGSVPLTCWLTVHFCKISLACLPHLVVLKCKMRKQNGPKMESFSEAILSSTDISSLLLSWCQSSYFRKSPTALLNLWWFPARQIWKLWVVFRTIQHIISALCLSLSFMIVYYWRRSGNYGTCSQSPVQNSVLLALPLPDALRIRCLNSLMHSG